MPDHVLREVVFDTETTGFDPAHGDRIVEIGCVELLDRFVVGEHYHCYVNPERAMPRAAEAVHGLSTNFLSDKPRFHDIAEALLAFLQDSRLIAHNASFDLGFLNAEFVRCGRSTLDAHDIVDTLALARARFPGAPNRLDDLCRRFNISLSGRAKHGALVDARLLTEVYIELTGGRQDSLVLTGPQMRGQRGPKAEGISIGGASKRSAATQRPKPLRRADHANDDEKHARFVREKLGPDALWWKVLGK